MLAGQGCLLTYTMGTAGILTRLSVTHAHTEERDPIMRLPLSPITTEYFHCLLSPPFRSSPSLPGT